MIKNVLKNKVFRICLILVVLLIVVLAAFRVPTRMFAPEFNKNTNLPAGILEKDVDWSEFVCEGGFGMTLYTRQTDSGLLSCSVSNWPDAIFGTSCVDYISCKDNSIDIYGFSVGDDIALAEQALKEHGFSATMNDHQFKRFGVIVTLRTEKGSDRLDEIVIAVGSTNIFGIVY